MESGFWEKIPPETPPELKPNRIPNVTLTLPLTSSGGFFLGGFFPDTAKRFQSVVKKLTCFLKACKHVTFL